MPAEPELPGDDPLVESELPLGQPGFVVHNELPLSGWAVSPKGIAGVAVQIGERQWNAAYGLDTPSLAGRLPGVEGAGRAGYHLAIDTSGWEPGSHYVTVAAFDRAGGRAAVEGAVEVRPFPVADPADVRATSEREEPTLVLDSPAIEQGAAAVAGPLEVSGWAYAADGIDAVLVTLDGSLQYQALRPVARPDLLRELGRELASDAGFVLRIDPADCPPGRHRLTVSAIGRGGRVAGVECDLECHAQPAAASAAPPAAGTLPPPSRAAGEPTDGERMWRDRALLAESEAALCRAETRLARAAEERARRDLDGASGRPA